MLALSAHNVRMHSRASMLPATHDPRDEAVTLALPNEGPTVATLAQSSVWESHTPAA